MIQMITGYVVSQTVRALAELSIADHLAHGPATAHELASKTSANQDAVARLLQAAASFGIVAYDRNRGYVSTPLLDTLRSDVPGSLRALAIAQNSPGHWLPMGRLTEAVRTGSNQSAAALGYDLFEYFARTPAEAAIFTKMMEETSEIVKAEAIRLIDTHSVTTMVDVGGASGALLCGLAAANPHVKGIVFDAPHVVDSAIEHVRQQGLSDRVSLVAGDFFQSVPPADLYLLKFILHDWDDDACIKILSNCAKSLLPNGRLVVVTLLLGAIGEPGLGPLADMLMLAQTGGKERTVEEHEKLFARSGLKLSVVTPTQSPFNLVEAVAA